MGSVTTGILQDVRAVLEQQATEAVRKTDALRQLGRTGVAAVAGILAGAGLLAQVSLPFPTGSIALLSAGTALIIAAVLWSTVASSLVDSSIDLAVAPDPEILVRLDASELDGESLEASRLDTAVRLYLYNRRNLAASARHILWSLRLLVPGALAALSGFALIIGGNMG